jgi:hypothetical protein
MVPATPRTLHDKKQRQLAVVPGFSVPERRPARAAHFVLCKPRRLCYTLPGANLVFALFLGSSAVEHSTVNRMVAGSNPARGATIYFGNYESSRPVKGVPPRPDHHGLATPIGGEDLHGQCA